MSSATVTGKEIHHLNHKERGHSTNLMLQINKWCCVKSKATFLILLWTSLISFSFATLIDPNLYLALGTLASQQRSIVFSVQVTPPVVFSLFALLYLFYPLAGCLADIKCGRYKTVTYSLWCIFWSGVMLFICILIMLNTAFFSAHSSSIILIAAFGFLALLGLMTLCSSYIVFTANVIQFGVDQLHDSPMEDSVLFINWFVFSSYLGFAVTKVPSSWIIAECWGSLIGITVLTLASVILLGASLCITRCKPQWFLVDSGSRNPYKLVYKVIKFATQHKAPIRRSAFTYCEDELPSRMDLGKEKYGGPFTTEQVEDVKVFLGILCLLLTLGPMFTTDTAVNRLLITVPHQLSTNSSCTVRNYFLQVFQLGGLSDILLVVLIPVYICLLRPFIHRYIPGMLKRLGLGMFLLTLSLLCTLLVDTVGHVLRSHKVCFQSTDVHLGQAEHNINTTAWYLTIPYALNALGFMLFYIAAYEFICAQSPHAMKGLLIGTFFAIKGVFQLIGALIIFVPFTTWKLSTNLPSCGFVYYLINVLVALIGLLAYTWVARRYQYRQRDEPDNIYRYAEEYYDRAEDESSDGYSEYNEHSDVHIIKLNTSVICQQYNDIVSYMYL